MAEEHLDLLLADGRIAGLAGVAADPSATGAQAVRTRLSGGEIRLAPLSQKPDRWGRTPAAVFTPGHAESLNEQILQAGLGLYRPDSVAWPCRDRLLAAEQSARAERLGIWSSLGVVLDAGDAKAILAASKGLVVVEGRVLSIGERRGRVYLNFGTRRTTDFTIVISKRNLAQFEIAKLPVRSAVGRRLRARGLIDRGFGPLMEITNPDALEFLDRAAEARQ